MKHINEIIQHIRPIKVYGNNDLLIENISFDSRSIGKNHLFIAVCGTQSDGHNFIDNVIEAGATAILCENLPETLNPNICYIKTEDSSKALGFAASSFYDDPSRKLKLVGITGTNGKNNHSHNAL
jgi:UDP-N-acetylmuramoyl-L-alanyl-D-glutamate--2,6-diaminopimelate ligase